MAMLMIISIVVVMTMVSVCTYLAVISKNQMIKNDTAVAYSTIDASSAAIIDIIDDTIKTDLVEKYPWINLPPDPDNPPATPYNPTEFVSAYKDEWLLIASKSSVEPVVNIDVRYDVNTKVRLADDTIEDYGCIVFIVEFANETHNYAFFAEVANRDGYEKGDFVLTWIS
jgi:hypothetical protein